MLLRRVLLVVAAVFGIGAVSLAFYRPPKDPGGRTTAVLVSTQEPESLSPIFSSMMASLEVRGAVFSDLALWNADWELVPRLAEAIPSREAGTLEVWTEEGPDGEPVERMRTTWHIRPEARWHDGTPVTADDFIFAREVTLDTSLPVPARDTARRIASMSAPDPHTLVVEWKEPFAYATEGHPALPAHQLRPIYERAGSRFHLRPEVATRPLGNGPYEVAEWEPGQYVVLERAEAWWDEPEPAIDRIVYAVIPDTTSAAVALEAGVADALTPVGTQLRTALTLERRAPERIVAEVVPGILWEHLDMNLDAPELSDVRVRRALLHAIDRQAIIDAVYSGRHRVAHSWLPPNHEGYAPDLAESGWDRHDPDRARRLLDEAGWRAPEGGGTRRNDEGEPLRLVLSTTSGNKERELVQQLLQDAWDRVGIDIVIDNQTANAFFPALTRRNFEHLALFSWVFGPSSHGQALWTTGGIPTEDNGWSGQNFGGLSVERLDELHARIPTVVDDERRAALFREQQAVWRDNLPAIPLYFQVDSSARSRDLQGWRPTGTATPVTWNVGTWELRRGAMR